MGTLRRECVTLYLNNLLQLPHQTLQNPIELTKQHIKWTQALNRQIIGESKSERKLLFQQLEVTLETAKGWFTQERSLRNLDRNTSEVETKITSTRKKRLLLAKQVEALHVQTTSLSSQLRDTMERILQCIQKSLEATRQTTEIYREAKKKLENKNEPWDVSLLKVAFVVAMAYFFSPTIATNTAASGSLSSNVMSTVSSAVGNPMGSSTFSKFNQEFARHLGISMPPSIEACSQIHREMNHLVPFHIPQSATHKPICSISGYWNALVQGFQKEDELVLIAAEGSNELAGQMETPGEELGGHIGLFLTPRIPNMYNAMRDYHTSCR